MSDGFKTNWLYGNFLFLIFICLVCFVNHPVLAQNTGVIPFALKIESRTNALPGDTISLNIIKIAGSEEAHGFDLMIGFDQTKLSDPYISQGELYDIPGEFEWEMLDLDTGPFPECEPGGCPSGLIAITSMADTNDGLPHPKTDPETGRIKVIPDNTVLFTVHFQVADYLDPAEQFIPIFFFWTLCSDNQIAFTFEYDGILEIRSAFSLSVFDPYDSYGWINITDNNSQFPTNQGAPDDCIFMERSERLCDFFNGGLSWGCGDVNSDGRINILDIIFVINLKYKDGPLPNTPEFADFNNDTSIDILDVIFLINYIYKDGPPPDCPQP